MASWLRKLFGGDSPSKTKSICELVRDGNMEAVRNLLESDRSLVNFSKNQYQMTPLHVAAHDGRAEIAQLLIENGATIDTRDGDASTPLFSAALSGQADLVSLLLAAGADPNSKADEDVTPIHMAAMNGHLLVVDLLLSAGADPLAKDKTGTSPADLTECSQIRKALAPKKT